MRGKCARVCPGNFACAACAFGGGAAVRRWCENGTTIDEVIKFAANVVTPEEAALALENSEPTFQGFTDKTDAATLYEYAKYVFKAGTGAVSAAAYYAAEAAGSVAENRSPLESASDVLLNVKEAFGNGIEATLALKCMTAETDDATEEDIAFADEFFEGEYRDRMAESSEIASLNQCETIRASITYDMMVNRMSHGTARGTKQEIQGDQVNLFGE